MQLELLQRLVKKDLNLLVFLAALLEEKHVSRTAVMLNISQATMSYYLQKLRKEFDDPLLIKSKNGMVLSNLGAALQVPLSQLFNQLDTTVYKRSFLPADAEGTIRFCTQDASLKHLLIPLLSQISVAAPNLCIELVEWPFDIFNALENGDIDVVFGGLGTAPPSIYGVKYYTSRLSVVTHVDHPFTRISSPKLEDVFSFPHVRIYPGAEGERLVDEAARKHGINRPITLKTPSYNIALETIKLGRHIACFNRLVVSTMAQDSSELVITDVEGLPEVDVYLYWNARVSKEPMHIWFREQINMLIKQGIKDLKLKGNNDFV
ncbi:LysR family transcriptional regulator [Photobacterium indicum]|uniref:LysR family transcriptional regulator n=1 Tax=Photobacterium indicum TaxID=81447 RepID=UPI003D0DDC45